MKVVEGNRVKVYNEKGELIQEREVTLEDVKELMVMELANKLPALVTEMEEVVRSKVIDLWSYPPFRDVVAVDNTPSSEVNTLDWSTLKSYTYTARRDLQVFELRVRSGVRARNTGSEPQTVDLAALVNNEVIVSLGSLTVDTGTTLEDFVDAVAVVDIARASRDISVDIMAKSSSVNCSVSLTPPILVEIGYLFSPRQKYRRVGDKMIVIPESVLAQIEREELERRVAERVLKMLEEEYELEIEINPRTGKGSAKMRRRMGSR
jgi:hypothetical protein